MAGEAENIGSGVAFCPHCDAPFFKNKRVALVGGGNSGLEAALDLSAIVKHVYVVEFASELKADSVLIDKVNQSLNIDVVLNAKTEEIVSDGKSVTALHYLDRVSNEVINLDLDGVFIQIGLAPNSEFVSELVDITPQGEIQVTEKCETSEEGIFAAGDVTTVPYKQIVVAIGEGAKAALAAFEYIALR